MNPKHDTTILKVSAVFFIGGLGLVVIAVVLLMAASHTHVQAKAERYLRCSSPAEEPK